MKRQSVIGLVLEVITTHPNKNITIKEIHEQVPELQKKQIQNCVGQLVRAGEYLHPSTSSLKSKMKEYKILSQEPYVPRGEGSVKKKQEKKQVQTELTASQTGEAIIMFIEGLKDKIRQLSEKVSYLQSEYQKETAAYNLLKKESTSKTDELKKDCTTLRDRIRQLQTPGNGKTLKLEEVITFKSPQKGL